MGSVKGSGDTPTARLRILETTDLHMQLLDYDYFADHPDENTGLIQLADKIAAFRAEPDVTSLLFDNGDFIQGNPLADYIAHTEGQTSIHPMIAAMNTLQYDAVTLGNHEFNYGVPFLQAALLDAKFAITCANIRHLSNTPLADPFVILDRQVRCDDGVMRTLRIGVIGFVTPQITDWDSAVLDGVIETEDIVATATLTVPQMKAAGADIIVALCHSGIGASDHSHRMENAAVPLAAVTGIDVILTGHIHEIFPDDSRLQDDAIDPIAGTLHGKPTVMAGFYGNCFGVVDLRLGWDDGTWRIVRQSSQLEPGDGKTDIPSTLRQTLTAHVRHSHDATLTYIRQPIAQTAVPIHSYFATIEPDLPQQLLAMAQCEHITQALQGGPFSDLPVLAATAPFRSGGRAGPGHYIDIAPGPLALRDAAAIYPFTNTLCAVRRTGAQIARWLERAASRYMQITPGEHNQPLINPHNPAYNSDTLFGLSYSFDLTAPAMFDPAGNISNAETRRLRDLSFNGHQIADDDIFIVATNSYRTNGGGSFQGVPHKDVLHISNETTRDILINHLQTHQNVTSPAIPTWGFVPIADTSATFRSAPAAQRHMTNAITHLGACADGFDRYRFSF